MESKKETAQQEFERATTRATHENDTVTTRSATSSSPFSWPPSSKSQSPSSPLLDYVRRAQDAAQEESRTARRVRQLMTESPLTSQAIDVPVNDDTLYQAAEKSSQEWSIQGIPMFTGVPLRSAMFDSPPEHADHPASGKVPATAARRIIKQ
jgi:hypothetical protein